MTHILVSNSSGKDSSATLSLAIERHPLKDISSLFCDTGNEHPLVYDYLNYLEDVTKVPIKRLKADFTDWWWHRHAYVRDKWPAKLRKGTKGRWAWSAPKGTEPIEKPPVPSDIYARHKIGYWNWKPAQRPMSDIEADEVVARTLSAFDKGPTGNPYLDLCMIKGRFPSRTRQFCTEFLKTIPATEHALELIDQFGAIESWQGVRADESLARAHLLEREDRGGGLVIVRPIITWTAQMVFDQLRKHGIKPNPLYSMGMGRVGCMPCINAAKDEILEISKRFPEHFDRIEKWEKLVSEVSKRRNATFFPSPGDNESANERGNIRQVVKWSQTSRGGKQVDFTRLDEPSACASSYGLCDRPAELFA